MYCLLHGLCCPKIDVDPLNLRLLWHGLHLTVADLCHLPSPCTLLLACSEIIIPDSEDEDDFGAVGGFCCVSASQAAVADLVSEAAAGSAPGQLDAVPAGAAAGAASSWAEEVVLRGVTQLTLLLPRDAHGELGLDIRCYTLAEVAAAGAAAASPQGSGSNGSSSTGQHHLQLTAAQLLRLIHSYYREQVSCEEQLQLLRSFPAAHGVAAVLRPAFLELAPVTRGTLLGPRSSLEGLRKATREPAGSVYELQLGC